MLAFVFDQASMPAPEATAESEAKSGVLGSLFGKRATDPKAPAGKTAQERRERDVQVASQEWQEVAATVFILVMVPLVGDDLKPTNEQANAITAPLVRILMRHYDPLRESSADVVDAATALAMFAMYMQGIWPVLRERQAQRKLKVIRGSSAPARPVPVERPVERPVSMATAQPSAGSAGRDSDPLRSGNGYASERGGGNHTGPVADVGLAPLTEALGITL